MSPRAMLCSAFFAAVSCASPLSSATAYPVGITCHWKDDGHWGLGLWGRESHWVTTIVEGPIVNGKVIVLHGTPDTFDPMAMYTFTMMDSTMATIDSFGIADVQSYDMEVDRSSVFPDPVVTFTVRNYHMVGVDGFETQQVLGSVFTADLHLISTRQTAEYLEATYTGDMLTTPMQYKIPGLLDGDFHTYDNAVPQEITFIVPVETPSGTSPATWGGIKALFSNR